MKTESVSKSVIYLIVGSLIFAIGKQMYTKIILSTCYRVTVATPREITGAPRHGLSLGFVYKVEGQQYEGSYGLDSGLYTEQVERNIIAHKYYVRFSCSHPSLSELMFDKEVPGSVVTIPSNGWEKVPE